MGKVPPIAGYFETAHGPLTVRRNWIERGVRFPYCDSLGFPGGYLRPGPGQLRSDNGTTAGRPETAAERLLNMAVTNPLC